MHRNTMSSRHLLQTFNRSAPAVMSSLLNCNFGRLAQEVEDLEAAGVAGFHMDVMDGHFVPNLTFGMPIVAAVRRLTRLPLDVHLMISDPQRYLRDFHGAGADLITFHVEAVTDPRPLLEEIRELGMGGGVAINPGTPLHSVEKCLDLCDMVLVMSVPAGFGGQKFDSGAIDRLRQLRQQAQPDLLLEVDGGISDRTIGSCWQAGAQMFVVGSAIFQHPPYKDYVHRLKVAAGALNEDGRNENGGDHDATRSCHSTRH